MTTAPDVKVRPLGDSQLNRAMLAGHQTRHGHVPDIILASTDGGEIYRLVRLCCGETPPA